MSITEKLNIIAANMPNVYEAGQNRIKSTIHFGDSDFAGVWLDDEERPPKKFPHKLGRTPVFVAIYANDVQGIKDNSASATYLIQTDRFMDNPRSYLYCAGGAVTGATTSEATRLIVDWDDQYVYVNAAASTRVWPNENISTFTMVCF